MNQPSRAGALTVSADGAAVAEIATPELDSAAASPTEADDAAGAEAATKAPSTDATSLVGAGVAAATGAAFTVPKQTIHRLLAVVGMSFVSVNDKPTNLPQAKRSGSS
jgi:hypothetical protein